MRYASKSAEEIIREQATVWLSALPEVEQKYYLAVAEFLVAYQDKRTRRRNGRAPYFGEACALVLVYCQNEWMERNRGMTLYEYFRSKTYPRRS